MLDSNIINYFSKKTLLIAEDHYPTREILQSTLSILFKKIYLATNGEECLEQVKYQKPDLLITDIRMPKQTGIECIEKIRSIDFTLPIIVISAFSDDDYLLKAANLDIQGYLLKPLDMEILENTLEKIYNISHPCSIVEVTKELFYDYANSTVRYQNNEILLTKKENDFFKVLLENKNNIVSYRDLEYEIWEKNGEIMSINSLRTLVKKLRSKLPKNIVNNISKTGYKLSVE